MTASERQHAWQGAERLLCVRLDALGDLLMTTAALRALRDTRPGRHITLLTSASGAKIAPLIPEIDDVIVYDAPWLKATAPRVNSRPEYSMADRLRTGRYDGAIIFTVYSQNPLPSAFLCYLADIPLRLAHCHENPYQLLTDWIPDPEPGQTIRHEVRRQLDLVAAIGCATENETLSLAIPPTARRSILDRLLSIGVQPERPWLAVHPGSTAASRRYPWPSYAAVCARLAKEDGWQVVFTGSAEEHELVERIRAAIPECTYSVAGGLELAELCALIERAPLLLSNNTGPVHIAAAVATPVVDLYALTNPQHTPWRTPSRVLSHDVPCRNCYKSVCPHGHTNCLALIEPQEVVEAVRSLAAETKAHLAGTCA